MYKENLKIMFEKSVDKTFSEPCLFDFYDNRALLGDCEASFAPIDFGLWLTLLYIDGKIWNKKDISRMFGK